MKVYHLHREQRIPAPLEQVFPFFAQAENLERITPPWVGFRFATPLPIDMKAGARIEYRLRLALVSVRWVTRVTVWDPPRGFVDVQERGPYRLWEHTHRFTPEAGGVHMVDEVRYALPFGLVGRATHALAVRHALRSIFDYRALRVREQFAQPG